MQNNINNRGSKAVWTIADEIHWMCFDGVKYLTIFFNKTESTQKFFICDHRITSIVP